LRPISTWKPQIRDTFSRKLGRVEVILTRKDLNKEFNSFLENILMKEKENKQFIFPIEISFKDSVVFEQKSGKRKRKVGETVTHEHVFFFVCSSF